MKDLSVIKVFGITEYYTLEQLKKSYIDIIDNLYKSDKTQVEKNLLEDQYKKLYYKGKQLYLDRKNNTNYSKKLNSLNTLNSLNSLNKLDENSFDFGSRIRRSYNPLTIFDKINNDINSNSNTNTNTNSNSYSYSSSYSSNSNFDGTKTIIKQETKTINGEKNKTIDAYKILSDGKKVPLTQNEINELNNFSNLQIS